MLERFIQAAPTDAPDLDEDVAATRERLKGCFAPGATRRMTQLGMLVGAVLGELAPAADDALVYASQFGESRALEGYLDSFPSASPTLFQTSIHPSGVQQALIGRQQSVREVFPLSGGDHLVASALLTALLAPAPRALLAGGEERGTWLLEKKVASDRAFAFALALTRTGDAGSLGRVALETFDPGSAGRRPATGPDAGGPPALPDGALSLGAWFDLLHERRAFTGVIAPGLRLHLAWT